MPPTFTNRIPRKRFHSTMITSPDGKGIIMAGGFILSGPNKRSREYLTTLIELRMNETNNEFFWTVLDQKMKIPREGPVLLTVPDDYCIQQDSITSMTWIALIIGTFIILGLLSVMSYVTIWHWNKITKIKSREQKIQTILMNELSTKQLFQEINPTYEQTPTIEVTSLPQLFVGNIEKGELIGNLNTNLKIISIKKLQSN